MKEKEKKTKHQEEIVLQELLDREEEDVFGFGFEMD